MSNNWRMKKLSEVADIIGGGTPSSNKAEYFGGEISWITPKDLSHFNSRKISHGERSITEAGLNSSSARLMPAGTVLFTSRAPIGYVAIAEKELSTNQGFKNFVLKEGNDIDFFYYLLKHNVPIFESRASGTTFKEVSGQVVKDTELLIPDLDTQKKIGKILSSFDNKIEKNNQINQTLEAMAQALFKSWFVDFDPVNAKIQADLQWREQYGEPDNSALITQHSKFLQLAAMSVISGKSEEELTQFGQENPDAFSRLAKTADLFPDKLVESELGLIPEGWEVTNFGEVSSCYDRMRIPLSNREREGKKGDIPYYGATSIMDYVNEVLFDGIYLLLGEDGSVLKPDGTPFIQYIWGKAWVNNHAHVLQGRNGVSTEHLMVFVSTQNITAYVTGAVQLKLNQKNMNSIPFINAKRKVNEVFAEKLSVLYALVRSRFDENKYLVQTRNFLIPKLLSGEINLSDFKEALK